MKDKNVGVAYLLWCLGFLGLSGIHRFYAGKINSGILYLITFGFAGIGQFVDLFLIPDMIGGSGSGMSMGNATAHQNVNITVGKSYRTTPKTSTASYAEFQNSTRAKEQRIQDSSSDNDSSMNSMVKNNPEILKHLTEKNPAMFLTKQAKDLLREGKAEDALSYCNEAISKNSEYAMAYSIKALALFKLERLEESLESIQRCMERSSTPSDELDFKAVLLMKYASAANDSGNTSKAIKLLSNAIQTYDEIIELSLDDDQTSEMRQLGIDYRNSLKAQLSG